MAVSTALRFSITAVFLIAHLCLAAEFNTSSLVRSYDLVVGRRTACPRNVVIKGISKDGRFVSANSMSANGQACNGPGGKAFADGSVLISQGLRLPSLVTDDDVAFFAGVETAPRTCGRWAFNASAVSWFVYKPRESPARIDKVAGLEIEPGYVYVTYEHFADFCAFRAKVEEELIAVSPGPVEDAEDGTGDGTGEGIGEGGGGEDGADADGGETTAEAESSSEGTRRECFPADATVQLASGRTKRMDELRVGDRILSSAQSEFSDVYFFSHLDKHVSAVFVRLEMVSKMSLSLTGGHFIYLNGIVTAAWQARPGDVVTLANGATEKIVDVRWVKGKGLYNPHTRTGNIVVNGILTTTWTTALPPVVAQSLLSPIRMHYLTVPKWVHELTCKMLRFSFRCIQETSNQLISHHDL